MKLLGGLRSLAAANARDGRWHHVAVSREVSEKAAVYLDGAPLEAATAVEEVSAPAVSAGLKVFNGADATWAAPSSFFTGLDGEVRVWNTYLTARRINARMHGKLIGNEADVHILEMIEAFIEDMIRILMPLFDWGGVVECHRILKEISRHQMREVRALTDKGQDEMRGMLVGLFGRTPAPGDLSKHPAGSTSANTCHADDPHPQARGRRVAQPGAPLELLRLL